MNPADVKLLYNILSELGSYESIDAMIADMTKNTDYSNGIYSWKTSSFGGRMRIDFAYFEEVGCDAREDLQYIQFDDLNIRNSKKEEYINLVNQRLSENGLLDDSIVEAQIIDGWENTYAQQRKNDLGIVVRFDKIDTSTDNISKAIDIVKVYVDCSNEIFNIQSPHSSELLAQDIVSRARLVRYNVEGGAFRICKESGGSEEVNLPCEKLLKKPVNPVDAIQYIRSGYVINKGFYFEKKERPIIIEYYIPMQVDGLQNK